MLNLPAGGDSLPKVLVSACLLGQPVRYDGGHQLAQHPVLAHWLAQGQVVAICPEVAGGLPTPRPPAEITTGGNGASVLLGHAQVCDSAGSNVTEAFTQGARLALQLAQRHGIKVAVLKEFSPSCGSSQIYDGQFVGRKVAGNGVTSALLRDAGIAVFGEHQWDAAAQALQVMASATGKD